MAAVGFEISVYLVIAGFGYVSTLQQTPGLFYERTPPHGFQQDYMMIIGQILVSVVVSVATVIMTLPCRHNVNRLIRRVANFNHNSLVYHVGLTFCIVAGSFMLSVFVPEVVVLLEFLGGTSPIFCNLLPALLTATTEKHFWSARNVMRIGLAGFICLLGVSTVLLKAANIS